MKGVYETNLAAIRDAYISLGKTNKEICAEYEVGASTLSRVLNKPRRVSWQIAAKLKKVFGDGAIKASSLN